MAAVCDVVQGAEIKDHGGAGIVEGEIRTVALDIGLIRRRGRRAGRCQALRIGLDAHGPGAGGADQANHAALAAPHHDDPLAVHRAQTRQAVEFFRSRHHLFRIFRAEA